MKIIGKLLIAILLCSVLPSAVWAQEDEMTVEEELDSTYTDIHARMVQFQGELLQLGALSRFRMDIDMEMPLTEPLLDVMGNRLKTLTIAVNSFTSRWDAYSQAQQVYIADNDSLLSKLAEVQQMKQMVTDTLASRQLQYDQLSAFAKAEVFIWSQDKIYQKLYKQAVQYSLSGKLAAKLEKVKAAEQAEFADVTKHYEQAKAAADAFPGLKIRMKGIDEKYFQLQTVSTKIQEMAYKPFIQRIKDYLMGLAAVAIVLMFLNMVRSKLKALKVAREQAQKMKDMMNGQHNYPTI
ncbi:hypothetical protein SAMN05216462_2792 [Xylanibacter ruminicola]|jgi:hypothetical protein|uniref:Uncharacterized protein n=1 Tax=Xylanibacter ruminicola TaxID=839 RepID=A0A1H4EFU3_XYLRU|nr:hypothetical protein [Xylanibacter ruminicola]SEA83826.1 hypothetical protein SAMN05216462_2792 [Xylanibacter ruminicola]